MMPIDRCSFEVVYKKDERGDEVIDHVVVRTGISDAAVSLTIPQVHNLAQLLDLIPVSPEHTATDRTGHPAPTVVELRRAETVSSE